jgi:hypothetical protein
MKQITLLLAGLAVGAVVALVPGSSRATIIGTSHDFTASTNYWINGTSDWISRSNICGVCHTIHHANPDKAAPLWAHASTVQTFTPYSSPTFVGGAITINASSKACLSCHDGSVAINQTYNTGGTNSYTGNTAVYIKSSAIIPDGTPANDLSNMHPIGFSYQTAASADPTIKPSTSTAWTGATIASGMLFGGQVECGSCHDIHCTKGAAVSGTGIYLVVSTTGSALCLTCHSK